MALQLFEEYGHRRHCTAMGATGSATRDGSAIIAQSWDQGWCIRLHGDPGPYLAVDSFYAAPAKREFVIARGYVCRHAFTRHQL